MSLLFHSMIVLTIDVRVIGLLLPLSFGQRVAFTLTDPER
jgi:hypothetical protein